MLEVEPTSKPRSDASPAPAAPAPPPDLPCPAPTLARHVESHRWSRRERRAAGGVVAASVATIAASALLVAWTFDRPERPLSVHVAGDVAADPVGPLTEPAPPDPPLDETPTARLASDDPIGEPIDHLKPVDGPSALRGVAAAADRYGVVAAWSDRAVWVSRDDGRSFAQELAAPGPLTAVAVGTDGRVLAARLGGRVAELTPGGHTRTLDPGFAQVLAIDAASSWLAILGLHPDEDRGLAPMLALSGDHGATWRRLVVPHHGSLASQVRMSADGVVDLLTLDADDDAPDESAGPIAGRLRHYRGHVDGRPFERITTGDGSGPFGLGHDGQSWQLAGRRSMKLLGSGSARSAGLAVRTWTVLVAASADHTVATVDGKLVELGAGRPRVVTRRMPGAVDTLAVDAMHRVVATAGGTVVRYSARQGWRRLFELPAR